MKPGHLAGSWLWRKCPEQVSNLGPRMKENEESRITYWILIRAACEVANKLLLS